MKCRHGITGTCAQCTAEDAADALLLELADAIVDMADELNMEAKVDRVRELARKLRGPR